MAIGPQASIDAFNKEVDKFEEYFDAQLLGKKVAPGETTYVGMPDGCYSKHFEELRKRYVAAGWYDVTLSEGGFGSNGGLNFLTVEPK